MKSLNVFSKKKSYDPTARPDAPKPARRTPPPLPTMDGFSWKELGWKVLTIALCAVLLLVGSWIASSGLSTAGTASDTEYFRTRVVDILGREEQSFDVSENEVSKIVTLNFTAEVLDGDRAGEVLTVVQQSDPYYQVELNEARVGDIVIVAAIDNDGELSYQYHAHVHTDPLIAVGVIFCVALLFFGHLKGLQTLFTLGFTLLSVYSVLVPAILSGQNIYLWTIIVTLFLIAFPLALRHGPRAETLLAGLGSIVSAAFMMGFTAVMAKILQFNGVIDEQSQYLSQINSTTKIDLLGIVFACICLGALGALTDLSWSVSSGLGDALQKQPALSRSHLFRIGLSLGQKRLSAVCQTMVVAFIGASLSATLLLFSSNLSLLSFFNRELVLMQILQLLMALFCVLLAIPFTALLCSLLYTTSFKQVYTGIAPAAPEKTADETTSVKSKSEAADADRLTPDALSNRDTNAATQKPSDTPFPESASTSVTSIEAAPSSEQTSEVDEDDEEGIDEEEQRRRDEIDAVEENAERTEAYRRGLFGNFARLYRELDEDFDVADERSKKKHKASNK